MSSSGVVVFETPTCRSRGPCTMTAMPSFTILNRSRLEWCHVCHVSSCGGAGIRPLAKGVCQSHRAAYQDGAVALTPNPHNHALLADKRNLILLSDSAALEAWGLPQELRSDLAGVPRTVLVTPENADALWRSRKGLFFKPTSGHGGKAVYRGDKVTKAVWAEIGRGGYVAQSFAAPGKRFIKLDGVTEARKMDVRLYTYDGQILLTAARLYQGQTTNFRTPGGGFAPVFAI